jgi:ATP-dependent helicase/nuclease subunit A
MVGAGRRPDDVAPVAAARAAAVGAAEDEYRRLLYVAMTRAADRLVVAGARGVNAEPPGCWYRLVHDALVPGATQEPADDGDGMVWRWRKAAPEAAEPLPPVAPEAPRPAALPDWLTRAAPRQRTAAPAVTPSAAFAGALPAKDDGKALARGRIVHRLLQALPAIPPARRAEAARRYVARDGADFGESERAAMAAEVTAVLDDPRFAPLFAPGSRAEVPIVGRVTIGGRRIEVSGQVDRLAITDASVLVADYKTNRPAPRTPGEIPAAYVTQLALYRAVLSLVYPGRAVRTALVWTDSAHLMEVPDGMLETALSRVA